MRPQTILTTTLLACWLSVAGAAGSRVGFVDMERIDREAPQIEQVRGELQQEFSIRERELLDLQQDLRELEARLVREGAEMDERARRKLERELQSGQREWKRKQDEFREDYIIRKNEAMEDLTKTITDTIRDFARSARYDVILVSGVVYASDAADVTGDILKRLATQIRTKSNDDRDHKP